MRLHKLNQNIKFLWRYRYYEVVKSLALLIVNFQQPSCLKFSAFFINLRHLSFSWWLQTLEETFLLCRLSSSWSLLVKRLLEAR